ncbi:MULTISPECIES: gamma-glutamyltransferase family protein [unclassified Beijerinckia]|uniref:gamma-glutamyltransferase family protein n=1 Tax=unclassified Beijerinckia TaxID=2638183 RepID=UPI00089A5F49|nr:MULTISPECIES: gamma-glutamyltransferase family protein [unclassified Beijerinckia]MDH7797215.1 gamma-glutamyltranspeptidase [Beijerinckia sp. GAS462]SEC76627.1 gamma-glutamyltransferase 2. Threonine peptidase. MEROPS family T03 [Beijerinckia sp. 28-YEA-48]
MPRNLTTNRSNKGMVTAPHALASQAGLRVLQEGGNAIEAMVAAAATIAVVYPHMNSIGGDGFWLISRAGAAPLAIDASGTAARKATPAFYAEKKLNAVPPRGPLAANTVAGTIAGWGTALAMAREIGGRLPLSRLVEDAIAHAEAGITVSETQAALTTSKLAELALQPGFAQTYLVGGRPPACGETMRFPVLARTLRQLAAKGTEDFYRGDLARSITADLARCGSPLTLDDFTGYQATQVEALTVKTGVGQLYNMPPPTQGLASLLILAQFDRLKVAHGESFDHIHGLIEATKQAFLVRDKYIGDPGTMTQDVRAFLADDQVQAMVNRIDRRTALPWPQPATPGDTIWMGAMDDAGNAVSFIQSTFFEFGCGVVLPETGICWQNRGASFSLQPGSPRTIGPGRKPYHTLNPAMARLNDGRWMTYGTMGGEGQPQTQSALFTRHVHFGQDLQAAISAPRWLLGATWGEDKVNLRLENRFDPTLVAALRQAGHDVELLEPFSSTMGHAGAITRTADGRIEGATDPRSDGAALGI